MWKAGPARRTDGRKLLPIPIIEEVAGIESLTELFTTGSEYLRPGDLTDLRISLALAQAAKVVLAKYAVFTPPLPVEVREAFRAHLLKTAPQPWREAVMKP